MKSNIEIQNPVFFIDTDRLNTSIGEMNLHCKNANLILDKLAELQVNTPENKDAAIALIYSGVDNIRKTITAQQIEKMSALPIEAAQKLVSLPIDALNRLNQIMYSFQNKASMARIHMIDFMAFADGQFQSDLEKLERHFTINRTTTISEAETLCNEFIQSFERLKTFAKERDYPGSVIDYDGLIHFNQTLDTYEVNPLGFQYFKR